MTVSAEVPSSRFGSPLLGTALGTALIAAALILVAAPVAAPAMAGAAGVTAPGGAGAGTRWVAAGTVRAQTAQQLFEAARGAETELRESAAKRGQQSACIRAAKKYRAVVLSYPQSGYCDDALFFEGSLYRDAAERFSDQGLAKSAMDAFALLTRGYPASKWVPKAHLAQVELYLEPLGNRAGAERAAAIRASRRPSSSSGPAIPAKSRPSRSACSSASLRATSRMYSP